MKLFKNLLAGFAIVFLLSSSVSIQEFYSSELRKLIQILDYNADNVVTETEMSTALFAVGGSSDGYFHKVENGIPVQYLAIGTDTSFSSQPIELIHKPAIVVNTTTTGTDIINESILFASDGDYEVMISCAYNNDATTSDAIITATLDGSNISTVKDEILRSEVKEANAGGVAIPGTGSGQVYAYTRTFYMPSQVAGNKNFTLRTESEVGAVECSVWDLYVTVKRIK